jgi:hypothetical protein
MTVEKLREAVAEQREREQSTGPEDTAEWVDENREMLERVAARDHAFAPLIQGILDRRDRGEL